MLARGAILHLRRCISVVAALGMLAHAAALERHKAGMLGAAVQLSKLAADLSRICHGGDGTGLPGDQPRPADSQINCFICAGLGPPCLDVAAQKALPASRFARAPATPPMGERREEGMRLALRPPVRGPPVPIPARS